ncbi:hypothetical protein T439DRAFT_44071 [Meredithblackwellia eburnea MCA 4105]
MAPSHLAKRDLVTSTTSAGLSIQHWVTTWNPIATFFLTLVVAIFLVYLAFGCVWGAVLKYRQHRRKKGDFSYLEEGATRTTVDQHGAVSVSQDHNPGVRGTGNRSGQLYDPPLTNLPERSPLRNQLPLGTAPPPLRESQVGRAGPSRRPTFLAKWGARFAQGPSYQRAPGGQDEEGSTAHRPLLFVEQELYGHDHDS